MAPRLAAEEPGHGAEWQKVPWRGGEGKAAAAGEGRAADLEYGTIDVHERGSEGAEEEEREEEVAPGVAEPKLKAAPVGVAAAVATCRGRIHGSAPLERGAGDERAAAEEGPDDGTVEGAREALDARGAEPKAEGERMCWFHHGWTGVAT